MDRFLQEVGRRIRQVQTAGGHGEVRIIMTGPGQVRVRTEVAELGADLGWDEASFRTGEKAPVTERRLTPNR